MATSSKVTTKGVTPKTNQLLSALRTSVEDLDFTTLSPKHQEVYVFSTNTPLLVIIDTDCVLDHKITQITQNALFHNSELIYERQINDLCNYSMRNNYFIIDDGDYLQAYTPDDDISYSLTIVGKPTWKILDLTDSQKDMLDRTTRRYSYSPYILDFAEQIGEMEAPRQVHPSDTQTPLKVNPEDDIPVPTTVDIQHKTDDSATAIDTEVVTGVTSSRITSEVPTPSGTVTAIHLSDKDPIKLKPAQHLMSAALPEWAITWKRIKVQKQTTHDIYALDFNDKVKLQMLNFTHYSTLAVFKLVAPLPLFSSQRFWVALDTGVVAAFEQDKIGFEWCPSEEPEIYVVMPWTSNRLALPRETPVPGGLSISELTPHIYTTGLTTIARIDVYCAPLDMHLYTPTINNIPPDQSEAELQYLTMDLLTTDTFHIEDVKMAYCFTGDLQGFGLADLPLSVAIRDIDANTTASNYSINWDSTALRGQIAASASDVLADKEYYVNIIYKDSNVPEVTPTRFTLDFIAVKPFKIVTNGRTIWHSMPLSSRTRRLPMLAVDEVDYAKGYTHCNFKKLELDCDCQTEQIGGYSYNEHNTVAKEAFGTIGDHTTRLDTHWGLVDSYPINDITAQILIDFSNTQSSYVWQDLLRHLLSAKFPVIQIRSTSVPSANLNLRMTQLPPGVTALVPLDDALQLPGMEFNIKAGDIKIQPYWNSLYPALEADDYVTPSFQIDVLGGSMGEEPVYLSFLVNPASLEYYHLATSEQQDLVRKVKRPYKNKLSGIFSTKPNILPEECVEQISDPQIETQAGHLTLTNDHIGTVNSEQRWQFLDSFQIKPTTGIVSIKLNSSILGPFFYRHAKRYTLWRGRPRLKIMFTNARIVNGNVHVVQSSLTPKDGDLPSKYMEESGYSVSGAADSAILVDLKWRNKEIWFHTIPDQLNLGNLLVLIPEISAGSDGTMPQNLVCTIHVDTSDTQLSLPCSHGAAYVPLTITSYTRPTAKVV